MSIPAHPPQSQVLAFAWQCSHHLPLADAGVLQRAFGPPAAEGGDPPTSAQLESVYDTACGLCDEGNFRFAAGLALHLATFRPQDPRFTFLAGTCMQRLGIYANAARFFCFSLISGGDNAASLYRLGECLAAVGDDANAEKALDAAFEAAREVQDGAALQDLARGLIERLQGRAAPSNS